MAEQERTRLPLTVTLDANLKKYIDPKTGSFYKKTLIKPTQLAEAALELWLKENNCWDHFQEFVAAQLEDQY